MTITLEENARSAAAEAPREDPESVVAMLRRKRKRQAAQRRRVFELPGYDDLLGARLRAAGAGEILSDEQVDETDAEALFNARRQTFAKVCVEIVIRDKPDSAWTPLAEELGDGLGPVRFDERLVVFLGANPGEVGSATDAVAYTLSQDVPFVDLYLLWQQWCALPDALDDDELVGESSAAS